MIRKHFKDEKIQLQGCNSLCGLISPVLIHLYSDIETDFPSTVNVP